MYKVFINDLAVEFILTNTFSQNSKDEIIASVLATDISADRIEKLVSQNRKPVKILTDNIELAWANFAKSYTYVPAAGGVVFNLEEEVLVIFRNGKWDLPKGKIEKNEQIETAALREVEEECGIREHEIKEQLASTWHTYDTYGPKCLKRTYWFIMHVANTTDLTPQEEEGIVKAEWLKTNEFEKVLANTYNSIQSVLDEALNK